MCLIFWHALKLHQQVHCHSRESSPKHPTCTVVLQQWSKISNYYTENETGWFPVTCMHDVYTLQMTTYQWALPDWEHFFPTKNKDTLINQIQSSLSSNVLMDNIVPKSFQWIFQKTGHGIWFLVISFQFYLVISFWKIFLFNRFSLVFSMVPYYVFPLKPLCTSLTWMDLTSLHQISSHLT